MTPSYIKTTIAFLAISLSSIIFSVADEETGQNRKDTVSPAKPPVDYTEFCDRFSGQFKLPQDSPARFALNDIGSREIWRALSILRGKWLSTKAEREEALGEVTKLQKLIDVGLEWPYRTPPTYDIPYAKTAPVIDGKINNDEWKNALVFSDSYQISETEKQDDGSVWKLMWNEQYLYFAVDFPDRNIVKSEDSALPYLGDSVEIFLMPSKRMKIYWEVIVGCDKGIFDGFHCNDRYGGWAPNPDIEMKNIKYETCIREDGYSIELGIPFCEIPNYILGNTPENGQSMHIAIVRTNKDKREEYPIYTSAYPLLYGGHNIFGHAKMILRK